MYTTPHSNEIKYLLHDAGFITKTKKMCKKWYTNAIVTQVDTMEKK